MLCAGLVLMMLAGCKTSSGSGLVRPELPAMPSHLSALCSAPAVKEGADLRSIAARLAGAFTACKRRHRDTLAFYADLRRRLAEK